MRQPTLKQLRYLCAVAEHQHFGQAASACHVSQSTLSAGILELEESLGISLVERNNRKVFLTSLGEEVVGRARDLLVDVEDLVSLCAGAGTPFQGRMRMGVIPTVAPYLLPGLLGQVRQQHPDFKLFIREDLSQPLVDGLLAGELDVLLLALPFPAEQVETMTLFEDDFFLACPHEHPLATRSTLRSADLRGEPLLLLEEGHCLREHALEACKLRDSQITVPYQATSLATIVQMVANGIGITLLPGMAVESGIATNTSLAVRPFDQTNVTRQIGLMWRKKTPRRVEFRQLGELIAELANR
ncbi:MAG: hydrogen peroxide-inducible genes activator [Halieaceae bacterium]|jgi:LysR family hydrogen peroxide-inducible transcriptional activator|nr:MAG: hydrogen peroxide-inducible genes activator [Halieaceae bacterium]